MKKITFLLTFLMVLLALPAISWAQTYPPTAPDGYDLVEDATALQSGDVIIIRQASGNSYLKIDNSRTTDASAATAFVLEDAGTSTAGDFYLKAQGTTDYLKAAATNGTLAATSNISEAGVFNIKNASESGSTPETTISFANFLGTTEGQAYVVRLITTSTSDGTSRIWYNSNGWKYNTGGGHWTGMFAFKQQVIVPGEDINYTVNVSGISDETAGVVFGGTTYNNGDVITVQDVIAETDVTAVAITGYQTSVSISGTKITVTYTDERYIVDLTDLYVNNTAVYTTTDPIVEGQWYILTQLRGGESPAYDRGANSVMYREATSVTANTLLVTNTPANDIKKYLFRFISAGVGNGYYVQTGLGNFWEDGTLYGQNHKVQAVSDVSSAGFYLAYNATQSADGSTGWAFNSTADGVTYGNKLDNDAAGNTLGFWGTGQTTSGGNNVWKLYPVELGALISEVTYDVIVTDGTNSQTFSGQTSAEGTTITAGDFLSTNSQYVTSDSHEITLADNGTTITLNCTPNFPFTISADPSDAGTASYYYMTLRTTYCQGNVSSASTPEMQSDEYLWAFGGDVFNGVTVYNKANGYMSVGSDADNSVATFSETPTYFTIQPNANETNGFNLNIPSTNAYINRRDGNVSTWLDARANGEVGSCLKVYSVDEVVGNLVATLEPYFTYAGAVNALTPTAAQSLQSTYTALLAAPDYTQYLALKADIEAALVPVTEGYYVVKSALPSFEEIQSVEKAMYYNIDNNDIRWTTVDGSAAQVFKLVASGSSYTLYSPLTDVYLATNKGVTGTQAEALEFDVTAAKPASVVLVYNPDGDTDAAIHANGHNNGNGVSGTLTNWTTNSPASMWRLVPVAIDEINLIAPEGVADGDEVMQGFANANDAQLPLNITVYTISDETGVGAHLETIGESQVAGGEGYIISGVKGATVPLLPVTAAVTAPVDNMLVAGDGSVVTGGYILAYKKGESEAKLWTIGGSGLTIPANRSYLPAGTPTRGLEFLLGNGYIDDVTGINGVNAGATTEGAIYDLQGRRVNNATKGVYIINGKKVIK